MFDSITSVQLTQHYNGLQITNINISYETYYLLNYDNSSFIDDPRSSSRWSRIG